MGPTRLTITADDWGYSRFYDRGIAEALEAGALDAVSVMVRRDPDPAPLAASGAEIGLHLELGDEWRVDAGAPPPADEDAVLGALAELHHQLEAFTGLFGSAPAYLDGHGHCHTAPALARPFAAEAHALGLPIRSTSAEHRAIARAEGAATSDRFIGRAEPEETRVPAEVSAFLGGQKAALAGRTEWMTHPGYPDPSNPRPFDPVRLDDLELLLELAADRHLLAIRGPRT